MSADLPPGAVPAPGPDAPPAYRTVARPAEAELVIKRSRFIGAVWPVTTREEAEARIAERTALHARATHNVPAYRVGLGFLVESCSDGGEPAGTAGRPALGVLQKEDLRGVALVVTRYFGGTLLGAAGLVRAYTDAAVAAIRAAGVVEMQLCQRLDVEVPYALLGKVQYLLHAHAVHTGEPQYGASVVLPAWLPAGRARTVAGEVTEWTSGQARVDPGPYAYLPREPVGRAGA
ncbi:IMPACT family protein [Caldinitratiruptor microaerophilus]|uniref:YigZ family protein n=1 Tax=Caldinitratiruptor microaerophilus TaxID=671077 RepID=A0AA35CKC3_9FIRM|nr:YigZ family protein [Caldinitratiruptor microaerophilus]BDG58915.1 YigZ family protein [Caldinitratiruptor microaerophilus]